MEEVLTVEMQIAARSREHPGEALTNLHSFIGVEMLHECFGRLNKKGAGGIDGQTWKDYNAEREVRIPQLNAAFKSGRYRAPYVRRTYIPKGDGKLRPLGVPTIEDKLLQSAVSRVLSPVYEELFYDFSYGFRPGKSQHQALVKLYEEVSYERMCYVIDADMKNYFGSINHQHLREFLDRRIKDGVIRRQLDKWLKAGIMEAGQVEYPTEGTPQGGSISPLLSNIYLHYVLDEWFVEQIQPLLKGKSSIIRFADDFLLLFTEKSDAERVMQVLPKRLGKYGLTLHPEKTKLIELNNRGKGESGTFDFLGFTHYVGKSRKGKTVLKRKTSSTKLKGSLQRTCEWLKTNRHTPIAELIDKLNQKLRGHYAYYGITFNSHKLNSYYKQVRLMLHKWLNRRGGGPKWNWQRFARLTEEWLPLERPRIYHGYQLAKP